MLSLRNLVLASSVALSFGLLPVTEAAAAPEPPATCKRGKKLRKKAKGKRKHHRKGRKAHRKAHHRAHHR